MKKLSLAIVLATLFLFSAFSQLTERENDDAVLKIGTRPEGGDMALTFAFDINGGGHVADLYEGNLLAAGDLLTFKYYTDRSTAFRAGIRLFKDSYTLRGDEGGIVTGDAADNWVLKDSESEILLVPGLEKHFNSRNIFDVYIGGDVLIGYQRDVIKNNYENGTSGDYNKVKATTSSLVFGVGGVVGVNVFIAQLPISVGVEYGLNIKYDNEGKTKVKQEQQVGGVSTSLDYYTYDRFEFGPFADDFSKMKVGHIGMDTNQDVRIVLNIYFGE